MLYLLQDGDNYKVGYSTNEETLIKRIKTYKTHNPTFKYLGLREGTKKDEKAYHKLLNCDSKSEWGCTIDDDLIENIKLDFTVEGYLASLFGETVELVEDNIKEIYSAITLCLYDIVNQDAFGLYIIMLCSNGVYIRSTVGSKVYKVSNSFLKIQTFYQNYDPEYGELYRGFVINGTVFYEFQISRTPRIPTGSIAMKDSILYDKLKPIMQDFEIETDLEYTEED